MALHYVGRYATSRARLAAYLNRKIRERGWKAESAPADVAALVEEFSRLGYIDDAAFAASRARTLTQRGFGLRRVQEDLRAKGIEAEDAFAAHEESADARWAAADRLARRKRIGPYAPQEAPPELRQKQLAAFLRAGHGFEISKAYVFASPGQFPENDD